MPNAARWILYLLDGSNDAASAARGPGGGLRARVRAWIAGRRTRLEIFGLLAD